jgi:hypothetical protein
MNEAAISLVAGLISGLVSSVITFFVTREKVRLDLAAEYDRKLRSERLDAYRDLFKRMKPLARYSPEKPLNYKIIKETSEELRDWYFDVGGIYLSKESRDPYFKLKALMQQVIDHEEFKEPQDQQTRCALEVLLKTIVDAGSDVRTLLTNDIGTRKGPFV